VIPSGLWAQPGSVDLTFGGTGYVSTPGDESPRYEGVAAQADGKIVAVGYDGLAPDFGRWAIVRYETDGSLDTTFGIGGRVTLFDVETTLDRAFDVAIDDLGRIVVVGNANFGDFAVVRLLADGSLDPSFGTGGMVFTDFGVPFASQVAGAVALQPDGKIVVGGGIQGNYAWAFARYNPDGSLDTDPVSGFGPLVGGIREGLISFPIIGGFGADLKDLDLQTDGKIVWCGTFGFSGGWVVGRLLPDGSADVGFGTNGQVSSSFSPISFFDRVWGVGIQGTDIVASGRTNLLGATGFDYAVARYLGTDGSPDPSFGVAGLVVSDLPGEDQGTDLVVQADGKLVVAGTVFDGSQADVMLLRLTMDGLPDPTFGTNGQSQLGGDPAGFEFASALTMDTQGRLITAGSTSLPPTGGFSVVRFNGDPPPIVVDVDIKPGGYPNCFNINGHGVIPVAVLGSPSFDPTLIDPSTVDFGGLGIRIKGNGQYQFAIADVGTWGVPEEIRGVPDGIPDFVCQFVDTLAFTWDPQTGTAEVTGALVGGTATFVGVGEICLTGK
jgi:uncharacterized delta-60 repeat protein